jgi:hypothetical protein
MIKLLNECYENKGSALEKLPPLAMYPKNGASPM